MCEPRPGDRLSELLAEAKSLATRYYDLTGRPLGITGEVAEYEASRLLGMQLAEVRQAGFDATYDVEDKRIRVQIKGRRLPENPSPGQRIGQIRLDKEWDSVALVLLGPDFEAREIWEAERDAIEQALTEPGSKARNERGALSVNKFKAIGRLRWEKTHG